jgi:ABC transporter DrrB family efflux protein
VDLGLIVGVVGALVGAIGLAPAFRARGKRRELDAELRRPEVGVKMAARGRESEGLNRIQASVAVTNMGATVATEVRFGLRVYEEELQADHIPELGIDETRQLSVFVPIKREERLQAHHARLEDAAFAGWRFTLVDPGAPAADRGPSSSMSTSSGIASRLGVLSSEAQCSTSARSVSPAIARASSSAATSSRSSAAGPSVSEDGLEFVDERRLRPHHARVEPGGAHQALAYEHAGERVMLAHPGAESGERRREPLPRRGFGGRRAGGGGLRHGLVHHREEQFFLGREVVVHLLPGLFVLAIGFGASQTGVAIAEDLASGMIDRFRSLPIASAAVLAGRVAADAVRNLFVVGLMIAVGSAIGFQFHAGPAAALAAVALAVAIGLAFSWLNLLLGLLVRNPESAGLAGLFPVIILVFTSSTLVPVATMPGWLQAFADVNPVTVLVDALRALCLGGPTVTPVLVALAWIAGLLLATVPASILRYRQTTA